MKTKQILTGLALFGLGLTLAVLCWPPRTIQRTDTAAPQMPTPPTEAPTAARPTATVATATPATAQATVAGVAWTSDPEAAPAWAVAFGGEFWRRPTAAHGDTAHVKHGAVLPSGVNLGDLISRVRHAFGTNAAGAGLEVLAQTYTATAERDGLRLKLPAADGDLALQAESRLRTREVSRAGKSLLPAPTPEAERFVIGNAAQALLNAEMGVVEHCEARGDGVEIAWVLDQVPPGSGPLFVEAELEGLSFVNASTNGLHFAHANGTPVARIGKAELVDARGRRWPLALQAEGSRFRVEVPETVLAEAAYPVAIDPLISPEFPLDRPASSPTIANDVAVAFNGTHFLVVWEELAGGYAIRGARWSSGGGLTDPTGITIANLPLAQDVEGVTVSAAGGDWLVAWSHHECPACTVGIPWRVYGKRVSGAGAVLDGSPIAISSRDGAVAPVAAAIGSEHFVVWEQYYTAGLAVDGARVTTAGTVAARFAVSANYGATRPAVASDGTRYLAAWQDSRNQATTGMDIYGRRFAATGSPLDGSDFAISTAAAGQTMPGVAGSTAGFLVSWNDFRNQATSHTDIYGARVSGAGVVQDPAGIPICNFAGTQNLKGHGAVGADATGFLVAWSEDYDQPASTRNVWGARVSSAGAVSPANGRLLCNAAQDQAWPVVALGGSQYLVAFLDGRNSPSSAFGAQDVFGVLVNSDATPVSSVGFAISRTETQIESWPAVAFNGQNYLAVWGDRRRAAASGYDIFGMRISPTGVLLDPQSLMVCNAPGDQIRPDVAALGGEFFVVWDDARAGIGNYDIYGLRFSGDGARLGTEFAVSSSAASQTAPAVAAGTSGYLVAWQDYRNFAASSEDIYAARVTAAGSVQDAAGFPVCTYTGVQAVPAVAFNGSSFFVVWEDAWNVVTYGRDIFGAQVSAAGVVSPFQGMEVCSLAGDQLAPAIAAQRDQFLVVWHDMRNVATTYEDIYGGRISPGFSRLDGDGFAICNGAGTQWYPSVAPYLTGYYVAWTDLRNSFVTTEEDVYGTAVSSSGVVETPCGQKVNTTMNQFPMIDLAAGPSGQMLLASPTSPPEDGSWSALLEGQILTDERQVPWLTPQSERALGVGAGHRARFRKAAEGVWLDLIQQAETLLGYTMPNASVAYELSDDGVTTINYVDAATDTPPQGHAGGDRDIHAIAGSPGFPAGGVDDFAMESSGYLQLPQAGLWTFTVRSDDGFRLRMGAADSVVMEFTTGRAPADSTVTVYAPRAGLYRYRLTYFEALGGAQVEFLARGPGQPTDKLVGNPAGGINVFQAVDDPPVIDAEPAPFTVGAAGHAVKFYKSAIWLDTLDNLLTLLNTYPTSVTAEASDHGIGMINYLDSGGDGLFTTGNRAIASPPLTVATGAFNVGDDDDFGMVATGYIQIPQPGVWTFGVNSDDGFRLRMGRNLELVSQFTVGRAPASTEARVYVPAAGYYRYELLYFEAIGGAEVEFYAFGPGQPTAKLVGDAAGTLRVYQSGASTMPAAVALTPELPEMLGANPGHHVRFRKAGPAVVLAMIDAGEALMNVALPHASVAFDLADDGVSVINYADGTTDLPPQGVFPGDRDIHWIAGSPPFTPGDVDDYAMRATGYLQIPTAGQWRFSVLSDDGFRLRMGAANTLVLEHVPWRSPAESVAVVDIPRAGLYRYELIYQENNGGSQVEFFARPPGGVDELVGTPGSTLKVWQDIAAPPCTELPSGLVAWWKGDGGARDVYGLFPGATVGGAGFSAGRVGQAFNFDGVNDYLQVGSTTGLKVTGTKLTMAAWVYPTGAGSPTRGGVVLSKEGEYFLVRRPDGRIEFSVANTTPGWAGWTGTDTGVYAPLNTWTHLAMVYDGATAKLYANGTLLHTRAGTGAIGDGVPAYNDLRLGNRQQPGFDSPFQGRIDEVAVFRRDLTAAEVQAVFATGSVGWCVPPSLRVVRGPTGVEVRWPYPSTGYQLQTTDRPENPASWTTVSSGLWLYDGGHGEWLYRDPAWAASGRKAFFRLSRP
jgi:hypothetical protein